MKVASLFCGCGGLDLGFLQAGCDIVWANDLDKYAVQTYNANFPHKAICADLNEIDLNTIPMHDVLIGGFPCQPFSMMGKEKGFDDYRGTLFFKVAEIIMNQKERGHQPPIVVLENVRNLMTHNNGKTFATIREKLMELGYQVFPALINSADYGVPQKRNRVFLVCFLNHDIAYSFPEKIILERTLKDVLETGVADKYFLSDRILKTILASGTKNYKAKSETDLEIARPLTATMGKMHRACQDNYVTQNNRIRRLTPRECARLQGFPDSFVIPVSDCQAYKQFGNAVTVSVSYAIANSVMKVMEQNDK